MRESLRSWISIFSEAQRLRQLHKQGHTGAHKKAGDETAVHMKDGSSINIDVLLINLCVHLERAVGHLESVGASVTCARPSQECLMCRW